MTGWSFVDQLVALFEREQIPYAIVGGMAAIAWGAPCTTQDVDLIVELPAEPAVLLKMGTRLRAERLSAMEPEQWAEMAAASLRHGTPLSWMTPAVEKIDLSLVGPSEGGRVAQVVLEMRCRLQTAGGQLAWFATPEGTVIGKLYFYWLGSERQLRDIAYVLQVQTAAGRLLDLAQISDWAQAFDPGLYQIWVETLDALGLAPS